jgi:hypothetical protein
MTKSGSIYIKIKIEGVTVKKHILQSDWLITWGFCGVKISE